MAKHCEVCNQDYADEMPACPHCASAAKKTLLAGRTEDPSTRLAGHAEAPKTQLASRPEDRDRTTQLAGPAEAPKTQLAGPAEAPKTQLAGEPPLDLPAEPPSGPHEDIPGELAAEEPAIHHEEHEFSLISEVEDPAAVVSDSAVDLGAPIELVEDEPAKKSGHSGSEVFVAELASDSSHVDLVEELAAIEPADHDSAVEVIEAVADASSPEAELTEDAALDVLAASEHSSAVDLGATVPPSEADISPEEPMEPVEAVGDSAIDLEGLPVPGEPASGRREPSDSAVDLGSHAEIEPPVAPSGEAPGSPGASDIALESLLAEEAAEEPAAVVEEGAVAAEEPVVSEAEVDDLLASLGETPPAGEELAAMAEEEAVSEAIDEAAAEEAAEEAAAEEAAEEEKPAKPVKQRSRIPALIGGAFLGLLLGAGGLIGARFGGFDVPAMVGVAKEEKKAGPQAKAQPQGPTAEQRTAMIRNGDWEEALKAKADSIDESKPDQLAGRGDLRLGSYLSKSGNKVNLQDPPLQQALADLQKAAEAKIPLAIYDLGLVHELSNDFPKAREEYTKGAKLFENDPVQKRAFQSALDRVELKAAGKGGAAFAPAGDDRLALLALLVVGMQAPPQGQQPPPQGQQPPQAPAEPEEAGFDFWQAARLAHGGKYADAVKALDKARQLHDQRRFSRLRKAQNPLSDPTEDIFLRCCDELKQYWLIQSSLREGMYLTDKNTPSQAVQDLIKDQKGSAATLKAVADKLIAEKLPADGDELPKSIDKLIADKKDAETKVADLTAELKKTSDKATMLADKLKTAEKDIKDRDLKLTAAAEEEKKLTAANKELADAQKKIVADLTAAKFLDPKEKDVAEGVRKALEIANMKDPQGEIRKQRSDLARLNAALKERWSPEQMMPRWLLLLDQNRTRPELVESAVVDVNRVKADPEASPPQKGQAQVVLGLALRNAEKFAEAKPVLEAALGEVDQGDWLTLAKQALKEASDPAGYYATQAEAFYNRGQLPSALAVMERALKVLPEAARPALLARRSLIELDAAVSQAMEAKGKLTAKDPMIVAARKDADEAGKANVAEGFFAAGRINEELGRLDAAAASYRKAMEVHKVLDADGARYRVALARVLSMPREGQPAGALPMPAAGKVGWIDPAPYPARYFTDARCMVLMSVFGLQAPDLLGDQPGLDEAEKLADQILNAPPGTVPFDVRAQALAIKGRWTKALQTYSEGVRPMMPRRYANGLNYLILNHPGLKRPDSLRTPNPAEAVRLFASGLNFYFARDYANAEKAFVLAIENDTQDARYFYFLGLSRLAQNRRNDALVDFDTGVMLERLNRPSPAAVSESLERVQGRMRRIVNDVRNRPER